ncbi:MAG: hypothetical protein KGJ02_02180 [Verrucomicrobiota bacterium]|nr:hypothetical protein [Verrucomicrobiota bacterium]
MPRPTRRRTSRRTKKKTAARRSSRSPASISAKTTISNHKALWSSFKNLRQRVDKAWTKLKTDVKRKANPQTILRDRNELLLLLGECNYMSRECARLATKNRAD